MSNILDAGTFDPYTLSRGCQRPSANRNRQGPSSA